jgi:hypothetical protein
MARATRLVAREEPHMKACGTDACNQGRGAPCSAGCDDVLSAQAEGARMCGAWPYVGTPTSPGKLTAAELDRHIDQMHGTHKPAPAIFGPDGPVMYRPGPTWRQKMRAFWDAVRFG